MPTYSKAELRQRILAVVNERRRVSDVEIWRSSAPGFFPWDGMSQELIALDQEQQLRRVVTAPGEIVIYAIGLLPASQPAPKPTRHKLSPRATAPKLSKTK